MHANLFVRAADRDGRPFFIHSDFKDNVSKKTPEYQINPFSFSAFNSDSPWEILS